MNQPISHEYPIIVLGAGIVGLTLAKRLSQKGLNVALVESGALPSHWSADGYDLRVSAITPASEQMFKDLGVWQAICDQRMSSFNSIEVWEQNAWGHIEFDSRDILKPYLGHIVENSLIKWVLTQAVKAADNITLYTSASPTQAIVNSKQAILTLTNGETLYGDLIVAADGAHSWLRQHFDFELHQKSYHQNAIVTTVRTAKKHQHKARQQFSPSGPLAFLPLADQHYCSIVWSQDELEAEKLLKLNDQEFITALTQTFGDRLGEIEWVDQRLSFPLIMRHAKNYIQPRIALVGDAAHTLHPLAGQGLNLGLHDVQSLADVLTNGMGQHKDLGDFLLLRKYERQCKEHNWAMLTAMRGFKELFGTNTAPIRWARNFGLNLTNHLPFIKQKIIRHALG